jgi:hypothetical protein
MFKNMFKKNKTIEELIIEAIRNDYIKCYKSKVLLLTSPEYESIFTQNGWSIFD